VTLWRACRKNNHNHNNNNNNNNNIVKPIKAAPSRSLQYTFLETTKELLHDLLALYYDVLTTLNDYSLLLNLCRRCYYNNELTVICALSDRYMMQCGIPETRNYIIIIVQVQHLYTPFQLLSMYYISYRVIDLTEDIRYYFKNY